MHFDPWTLGLQAANFLVLMWLLHRFLWRPVLAIIAERQAAADKLTAGVEADRQALQAQRQALEQREAALAAKADAALAAGRDAAAAEREALLAKARSEAEAMRAEAKSAVERDRSETVRGVGQDAARLAGAIARRLVDDGSGAAVQARMLDLVLDDLGALPDEARRGMAERLGAGAAAPVVATASPLAAAAAEDFAGRLAQVLGAPVEPTFQVDPALIAGVEVRFAFTILRRNWADSLTRIEAEMTDDERASPRS